MNKKHVIKNKKWDKIFCPIDEKRIIYIRRHLKNWLSIVILNEVKNLVFDFEWKSKILRRSAPQNDIDVRFFRCLIRLIFAQFILPTSSV